MKSVSLLAAIAGITWWSLWFTPDQQGQRHMNRGEFRAAAETFRDPMREGVAWFRGGERTRESIATSPSRGKLVERKGGDMGDQQIGADEITFDKSKNAGGQDTETDGAGPLSDAEMQALWLRRIQTRPADFLKSKFAYQLALDQRTGGDK